MSANLIQEDIELARGIEYDKNAPWKVTNSTQQHDA